MTAYGAVNSLRNTIDYILHSSHFILVDPSPRILQLADEELDPLQEILESLDRTRTSKSRKKVNGLDGRIKDLIWEFEDALESLLYQQILSQVEDEGVMEEEAWESRGFTITTTTTRRVLHKHEARIMRESQASQSRSLEDEGMKEGSWGFQHLLDSLLFESPPLHHTTTTTRRIGFSIDLQFLQHHVPSFIERLKDMEEEYIYEVDNMPEDDDEEESIYTRRRTKSKMIGLSDQIQQLKEDIMQSCDNMNFALVGTAGVGKTALAEVVFEDPKILRRFEHRAWVRVGRKSQFDDVFREILAQMFGITQGNDEYRWLLGKRLEGKKCLIVLDDVWERRILDSLLSSLRNIGNISIHILVTTRDRSITYPSYTTLVRFMNEEESKELLCEKVFGENGCPFNLTKPLPKLPRTVKVFLS
ncbi:disease resistance protein RPP13-like [Salvia miltiorrhiza]|uniref:disease resistance protein RPP13-like n=1 Tax=Salvia miltiorrhiza TaxID=226208 RepID=UPI0025ABED40|nr:disease resistance protein RPP13-like [Salvia miltiorrhiza]